MTQEEKQLLLKNLCARLLYRVHCRVLNLNKTIKENNDIIYGIVGDNIVTLKSDKDECYMYYQIKPYLRPLSSMTEEELIEYKYLVAFSGNPEGSANFIDWLNKKMFAYRTIDGKDMFELGLALVAPEGMYEC